MFTNMQLVYLWIWTFLLHVHFFYAYVDVDVVFRRLRAALMYGRGTRPEDKYGASSH